MNMKEKEEMNLKHIKEREEILHGLHREQEGLMPKLDELTLKHIEFYSVLRIEELELARRGESFKQLSELRRKSEVAIEVLIAGFDWREHKLQDLIR